ncbi:GNAT family N-acetyltransferase [Xylophilus rhododendri]|uniref:GNAT family N-acetyltransferase n=1 Tax=Xylophilus rhododendri TaxID=2697032 RepID=A0A857J6E0_9BURK|nr:GNAT family N-acetyltransferase [Xylophilus rhododendri]QHI99560.1 GNAT family N-acetyltransferase [Xylophilus rhododendri]
MFPSKAWLQASLHAGSRWLRPARPAGSARHAAASLVPIRVLGPSYRERIRAHLLALDEGDRYLRFGYVARDAQINQYVARLDFDRDEIFGIYNRRLELIAVAHLAYGDAGQSPRTAEFGVSVVPRVRGRGFGGRLFARAIVHARNAGIGQIVVQALSENAAMLKIARKAGATVQRDGSESQAYLALPPATLDSRVQQWWEAHIGETDYRLKRDSKRFWDWIGGMQEVRKGVRSGRLPTGR